MTRNSYTPEERTLIYRMASEGAGPTTISRATEANGRRFCPGVISGTDYYVRGRTVWLALERENTPAPEPEPVKECVRYRDMVIRKTAHRVACVSTSRTDGAVFYADVSLSAGVEWAA